MSGRSSYFVAGVFIALAGSVCFSTKAIFVKLAYRDTTVDAISLLALRMIFSLPFFVASAWVSSSKSDNVKFTGTQWIQIAIVGAMGYYVSSLLDFLGLRYISAGLERLILFVYPTIVVLISAYYYKQEIKGHQWGALALTYLGLFIAFAGEVNLLPANDSGFYLGSILVFACAITFAIYIVGSGRIIPVVGAAKFNSYAMSFAAVGVLSHYVISNGPSLLHLDWLVYAYAFSMAILATVIPSYLISEGIKRIGSDNAAIVASIGPVSTLAQAYFFLGEPILTLQIVGTVLILTGVVLVGWKPKRNLA